jgi:hypothetical protein
VRGVDSISFGEGKHMSNCLRGLWLGFVGWLVLMAAAPAAAMDPGSPPAGFQSAYARIDGTSLHYVRGGSGPPVILLHGFPEDWVEYRTIMRRLAKRFTVVAVDLPGIGKSAPPKGGYGIPNVAAQIHALAQSLRLQRAYLVGHDVGGHVAYAPTIPGAGHYVVADNPDGVAELIEQHAGSRQ